MLSRLLTVCGLAAATVLTPTANAVADDVVTFRITAATFAGGVWIDRGGPGRASRIEGRSTTCQVAGVHVATGVPFVTVCEYAFVSGNAPLSSGCTGAWTHVSTLSFVVPVVNEAVVVGYDPTVTKSVAGAGTGDGVNQAKLGTVHFTFETLCQATEDSSGNMVGHARLL